MAEKREPVIVSCVRTPVGKAAGSLSSVPAEDLGGLVIKEAVHRAGIDPGEVEDVIFGNCHAFDVGNVARVAALSAGLPVTVPGITIGRECPTGLNALALAAITIEAGHADVLVAGGTENDSRWPYVLEKVTVPYQFTPPQFVKFPKLAPGADLDMRPGHYAERLAQRYGLTRQQLDEFALRSHQRAARAWQAGLFDEQIVPVSVPQRKGDPVVFSKDECFRADASIEALAKLRPAFTKDGVITAGNSCPISDGAGAMVVMEKRQALARGLEPLATFRGYAVAGVEPLMFGIAPVPATRKLLELTGLSLEDIDLIEMNEAFAAFMIICTQELGIDVNKLNVNGGAIAHGHPTAATGAILTAKMVYELRRRQARYGLITFCGMGGVGVSVLLERG